MIIFVYGDDTFRAQEKVLQLRRAFKKKHDPTGMNTSEFPPAGKREIDQGEVLQAACSMAFMGGRRLVVVRDLLDKTNAKDSKRWIDGLEGVPKENIVILWEQLSKKQTEKHKIYKALVENDETHTYAFEELIGRDINRWVKQRIETKGGTIETPAMRDLIQRVGTDLWQLSQDIDKLVNYAGDKTITSEMVSMLVRPSFEGQIFDLMDAISNKNATQALRLLDEERKSGANDFHLIGMLARQVRILMGVRAMLDENQNITQKEAADRMGLHPFVAKKALSQARKLQFEKLREVHDLLFEYDLGAKSGLLSAEMAVDLTTADLLR
jgi:DNA polymerase-3 subunit delta